MKFTLAFGSITLLHIEFLTTTQDDEDDWPAGVSYERVLDLTDEWSDDR